MAADTEAAAAAAAALAALACARCAAPARLQCPRCLELGLERDLAAFCSQDCFKAAWGAHKALHKPSPEGWHYVTRRGVGRAFARPEFEYTGALRPHRVGPTRAVPEAVPKPDWYFTGAADEEARSPQQHAARPRAGAALAGIRAACALGRAVLDEAAAAVAPGVTTDAIDAVVHAATLRAGAYPSPLNYYGFPKSVCTSVNEVICHGIPDRRPLEAGDIVNVDVSVFLNGWHGDLNETFVVGPPSACSDEARRLVRCSHDCLADALAICRPGARYRDLGEVIARRARAAGFGVVTTYCGHGIGDLFHCAPSVPHYAKNKARGVMRVGEVFTVEPMINAGSHRDRTWPDGWTSVTEDGKPSAQFEHQLVITADGCEVLTARTAASPPLWWETDAGRAIEAAAAAPAPAGGAAAADLA
jgi:methionyl aminopeptidase